MAVVGMAPAGPPPSLCKAFYSAGAASTGNGDKGQACSESLLSARGKFGLFSAPHSSSTHILGWVKEGQVEWRSIMEKISAGSGFCMSVGLSEVLGINSSSCHEETVPIFTIFNM